MIWYFHTLQNDHHKSSYQGTIQSYYSVIITVFPMLCVYISVTHLFCNWKSVPLSLHHPFHSSPHLLLVTTSLFSLWVCFFLLCWFICFVFYISHVSEIIWYLSFNLWIYIYVCILAASVTYWSFWARDRIWATAVTYTASAETPDPLTHCAGPEIEPV